MKILTGHHTRWETLAEASAVSIGVFDGVHLGHRATLKRLVELAGDLPSVVVTFDPHPAAILAPERAPKMLTTIEQRAELMAPLGIDAVAVLGFDAEVAAMSATAFIDEVLVSALRARMVVVGEGFRFGAGRRGDGALLGQMGLSRGFAVEEVGLAGGTAPYSSTVIRSALAAGRLAEAEGLLGRRFSLAGTIVDGAGRGASIGIPTANLGLAPDQFIPARGVYAVRMHLGPRAVDGVCNVGVRPTFGGEEDVVEVHVLDFDEQIRGMRVEVEFVQWIRPERRFEGVDALVAQIRTDIDAARAIHAALG